MLQPFGTTGRFFLLANEDYSRATFPDQTFTGDVRGNGGLLLRDALGNNIDAVGFTSRSSAVGNQCTQTLPAPQQTGFVDQSVIRVSNNGINALDFVLITPSSPRNSTFI